MKNESKKLFCVTYDGELDSMYTSHSKAEKFARDLITSDQADETVVFEMVPRNKFRSGVESVPV